MCIRDSWDAGVVVVTAAGNVGAEGHFTITSPGTSRKIITVGSMTDNGTLPNLPQEYVSTYSSRGPTAHDLVLKPDLVARGNLVVGAAIPTNALKIRHGNKPLICGVSCESDYVSLSGSSMAAARVSGAAALLLAKTPDLSPASVKARLMRSTRKLSGDPTAVGAGILSVKDALNDTTVVVGEALSPLLAQTADGTKVLVENTGELWGSADFQLQHIYHDSEQWIEDYSDGAPEQFLLTDGNVWQGVQPVEENGVSSESYLWANSYLLSLIHI